MTYRFEPIGVIHSPFREKFGIPRQPGLVPAAEAVLELHAPYARPEALRGLEGFSHVWIEFVFHATAEQGWKPTVRPPRLGGNRRLGVFATRSSFRPNPIGLSVVRLLSVETEAGIRLRLGGIDLLDGTPVLDIKPYLPYADCLPDARGGFAPEPPQPGIRVEFSERALEEIRVREQSGQANLKLLIEQLLGNDPRPAYRHASDSERVFGLHLFDFDLRWKFDGNSIRVLALEGQPNLTVK